MSHFIGVQSDVTARRRAEDGLRRASRELEEANLRMRRDLEAAARIQRSLLPTELPRVPGLELAWAFAPCAELAGDNLNLIRLGPDLLALYILDVSGHGVPAALLSVTLSHTLSPIAAGRSCLLSREGAGGAESPADPADVVARLNRQFPLDAERRQYFTIVYGLLEPSRRTLRYVAAGHPPPVLLPVEGPARALAGRGLPVGMIEGAGYQEERVTLGPGERLVLYTDGVVDALADEEGDGGEARLMAELERTRSLPLAASLDAVKRVAEERRASATIEDDLSLLALEFATAPAECGGGG